MSNFLKEFKAYRIIYILLIIGFSVFILSTTIIFSIYKQIERNIEFKYSGKFKYVYSVNIEKYGDITFDIIHKSAEEHLNNCSIITSDVVMGSGGEQLIGIFNYKVWSPPLLNIIDSSTVREDSIIIGKQLFHEKVHVELDSKVYNVGAIAGLTEGRSIYDSNIYVPLNLIPNTMESALQKNNEINILVRSNHNIKKQLGRFINELKSIDLNVEISKKRLNFEYLMEGISNGGAREAFSFPLKVCLISAINGFIVIYYFNYVQRKKIALEKALGASDIIIIRNLLLKLLFCIVPASINAYFITFILIKLNFTAIGMDIVFGIPSILIGFISTAIICIITSTISYFSTIKIEPIKILK